VVHDPQCIVSPRVSTQLPLQLVEPPGQPVRHVPSAQTWADVQAVAHAPQWS
jgi:hypothetical protein